MSRQRVARWFAEFRTGRVKTCDVARGSGPTTTATAANKTIVECAILENRRVTMGKLTHDVNISRGTVSRIIVQLEFIQFVRWIQRVLSEDHKTQRIAYALPFLEQYRIHGEDFLECTATCDETCVHHSSPKSKRASME